MNWLHCSRWKPKNAGNSEIFENFESFVEFSKILPWYARYMVFRLWTWARPKETNIFQLICHINVVVFFYRKDLSPDIILWYFSSKLSVLVYDKSIPFIYMPFKWGFLNFLSFASFRIGPIDQRENPEMPKIFKYLKTLIFLCQVLRLHLHISRKWILGVWIPIKSKKTNFYTPILHLTFTVSWKKDLCADSTLR